MRLKKSKAKKKKKSCSTGRGEETSNCFPCECDPVTLANLPCSFTTGKPASIIDLVAHTLTQHGRVSGPKCLLVWFAAALEMH